MLQQAIRTIRTLLPANSSVTNDEIENAVDIALNIPNYADLDRQALIREMQSIYNVRIDDFRIIESHERRLPWINERKASLSWNFWNRYRDYLNIEKGFSTTVINQLDRLTDRTLDGLFDPQINAQISKYGLVVGQVQSGKTSNYTGLICKAADAGYKLIIVLAGTHNNLRSQTQLRLDEGFLGFDTQHERAFRENNLWIGVGRIEQNSVAHSLTSSISDFNTRAANAIGINFNTNEPIIAVVKKNAGILNRLIQWLSAQAVLVNGRRVIRNKSLLLIDDEADHASINTRPEDDGATRINSLIRDVLRLFDKSGYIGYTATPFANIFIPIVEDQLFPRDFIINLPPPSNYIGPDKIFGFRLIEDDEVSDTVLPIVHRIDDYQDFVPDGHRNQDQLPTEAPESLKLAIRCFILTCAIRRLRGQTDVHNSMLIHVTRFIRWQAQIRTIVENVFDFYRRGIEMNVPSVIEELRQTFAVDTGNYKSFRTTSSLILDSQLSEIDPSVETHEWSDVLPHLNEAASRIQVRELNGGSADALTYFDYKNGLSVIAIGGDKLSRGLTLEGLSVSYYLRASRMYDTLMQMGRWFGYRPGYVDLCRLFTSRDLNEWFCHIALASDELRNEFDYMSDVAGSTPEQYALRVRTHPGVLQISASNKIRRAVTVNISWAGRLVESYEFPKNRVIIRSNLETTVEFIQGIQGEPLPVKDNYLWFDVPAQYIRQLLHRFRLSENLKAADPLNLLRFIDVQLANNELTSWRVAVMSKKGTTKRLSIERNDLNLDVGFYLRNHDKEKSDSNVYYLRKSHIISPRDEFIDLEQEDNGFLGRAMERTRHLWQMKGKRGEPSYPNGEIVRNEFRRPQNPLLLLYLLDPEGANRPEDSIKITDPIVGYAISFPGSRFNASVSYAVHEQLLPLFSQDDYLDDMEDDED
ncbi:MAG: Z1 domain-containing protein [Acidobacteriota bacterium]|nr:Z1 domain-containing protein [Acidobacteriota bacterium]